MSETTMYPHTEDTNSDAAFPELDLLETTRLFMDAHCDQALTIDDLAAQASLSPYHFIRLFRRRFYETPHRYLIRKRLEKAKALLADSSMSVTEICFDVGFESVGSFSTLFHKSVGWSPSIYRARVWAQRQNPYAFIPNCMTIMHGIKST